MIKHILLALSIACFSIVSAKAEQLQHGEQGIAKQSARAISLEVPALSYGQKMPHYITVFAHGLGGNANNLHVYKDFIGGSVTGKNGPEWNTTLYGKDAGPRQSTLAQEADIAVVADQMIQFPHAKLILAGVSKGAATMVNTVGWLAKNNPALLHNVAAVVVESPFDSMEVAAANMMHTVVEKFGSATLSTPAESGVESYWVKPLAKYFEKIRFKNYNPEGISPIKAVREMWPSVDKNLVIVFVHSQEDEVISVNASRVLYAALKEHGFKNLYFIETERGAHAKMFWGPEREVILEKLCYIYLHHNLPLPHDLPVDVAEALLSQFEQNKHEMLAGMQPSVDEINARVHPWLSKVIGPKGFKLLGYAG